jgi:hypothetical protein
VAAATALCDTAALLQQLRALVTANRACLAPFAGELALKLTIDGAGKVTRVELVRGDAGALACLKGRVLALVTGTRAASRSGMAEVVIRL